MSTVLRRARVALLLSGLAAGATVPAAAQQLTGAAVGPDGEPLADVTVVLHRVGAQGGAIAGTDTTDANGIFGFQLPPDSAVYFAALRYRDGLYIGPAAQAGDDPVTGYVLQVSPETEIGALGSQLTGPTGPAGGQAVPSRVTRQTGNDAGALWLVSILALTAAAIFVFTAPRYRERRTRDAVIEIAGIENRLAEVDAVDADERARLEDQRDRLKEQLAPQG
ncbi:MAG: hypothetical protein R3314_07645 [Longimicrobiales bacterium]|nr:hypothetical protein [Longimicrobiales bacterium]